MQKGTSIHLNVNLFPPSLQQTSYRSAPSDVSLSSLTFQVEVLGAIDALAGCRGVDLQRVGVAVVPGDDHIVPLVVVKGHVALALDEVGPVPQVKHVVDVPAAEHNKEQAGWRAEGRGPRADCRV